MATKLDSVVEVYAILQLRSPFRQKDALSGHANGWQDKQIVFGVVCYLHSSMLSHGDLSPDREGECSSSSHTHGS